MNENYAFVHFCLLKVSSPDFCFICVRILVRLITFSPEYTLKALEQNVTLVGGAACGAVAGVTYVATDARVGHMFLL